MYKAPKIVLGTKKCSISGNLLLIINVHCLSRNIYYVKLLCTSVFKVFGFFFFFFFFLSLSFLGPHPWHMEVPRLGIQSQL